MLENDGNNHGKIREEVLIEKIENMRNRLNSLISLKKAKEHEKSIAQTIKPKRKPMFVHIFFFG